MDKQKHYMSSIRASSGVLYFDAFKIKKANVTCVYTISYNVGIPLNYNDNLSYGHTNGDPAEVQIVSFSDEAEADTFYAAVEAAIEYYKGGNVYEKLCRAYEEDLLRFNRLKQQFACR